MLVGGEPGIGKSTLLLQVSGEVAANGSVLYISGEESAEQISLRAERLGVTSEQLELLCAADTERVIQTILDRQPSLVIIDSIQTLSTDRFASGPGSIVQVRESAARLQTVAKTHGVPIVIVGHVTKEGSIAGPKVLEHVVDTVLYLEGERFHGFRLLRGVKNRFGPTDEVGVLAMEESGLTDVPNPVGAFVDQATRGAVGTAITASLEGTRTLLVELQALAAETSFGYPKRTSSGFDLNKLQLLVAVLSKHAGLKLASSDIYFNVSGGYRLAEPAGDLAASLAIASASRGQALAPDTIIIGEVGLSGEVRGVRDLGKRLAEAKRAGFTKAIVPKQSLKAGSMPVKAVATIGEAVKEAFAGVKKQERANARV